MIWDIMEHKITQAGLAFEGDSLFRFYMPPNVKRGVMIKAPLTGIANDPYLPGYHKPVLQVIVRSPDAEEGESYAQAVQNALTIAGPESHPATAEHGVVTIMRFFPREMPIRFPRLDGNGLEWSLNFETAFSVAK